MEENDKFLLRKDSKGQYCIRATQSNKSLYKNCSYFSSNGINKTPK